jgi:hypothetical protein
MRGFFLYISIPFLLACSVHEGSKTRLVLINGAEETLDSTWINLASRKDGMGHSGKGFYMIDSLVEYGVGIKTKFPSVLQGKSIQIKFNTYLKPIQKGQDLIWVVSISSPKNNSWSGSSVFKQISSESKYQLFSDSVAIPSDFTTPDCQLTSYLYNPGAKSVVAVDDLRFEFSALSLPSYINRK